MTPKIKKTVSLLGIKWKVSSKSDKSLKSISSIHGSKLGQSSVFDDQSHRTSIDFRGTAPETSTPKTFLPDAFVEQQAIVEEDSFYVDRSKYTELQEKFDELHRKNAELQSENQDAVQKIQQQHQLIKQLKDQLAGEREQCESEKQSLLVKHQDELKRKDAEMIKKELSVFQNLSSSIATARKKEASVNDNTANLRFGQSNIQTRSQLTNASAPAQRPVSPQSLISKDRHRVHLFSASSNQAFPDCNAIVPLGWFPKLLPLFHDLLTYAFHLHNSSDTASQFTNDWLNNIRPKICKAQTRVSTAELLSKLNSIKNEGIEHIIAQMIDLLKDNVDVMFGLKRDLVELHKREKYRKH